MALATSLNFSFVDEKNKTSATRLNIPSSVSMANAATFAQQMAQLTTNISTAQITDVTLAFALDLTGATGLNSVASAFSSVAEKAMFILRSAVAGFKRRFSIPTWDETSTVLAGTDTVDITNTDVLALVTALEDGITITGAVVVQETDKYGNDLEQFETGREIFLRHI
jgi:hypothetical protein